MKKTIAIVGGGACALMLACELDPLLFEVSLYEKNSAAGRKFLVAGDGGFNLTHSEPETKFITRYTPSGFLNNAFSYFSNIHTIAWLKNMGIETFTGSSGRIFPKKEMKPIDVLNVFLEKIKDNKFPIQTKSEWKGFTADSRLIFQHGDQRQEVKSDYTIFCVGGASWPVTGSVGDWTNYFSDKGICINAFEASNCAYKINWPQQIVSQVEGQALKNCTITCNGVINAGEIVLTAEGIEGSGIYPLSPQIRQELKENNAAEIFIDLKPALSYEGILEKIKKSRTNKSFTKYLSEALNINPLQMALLKTFVSKEDFLTPDKLSAHIKKLKLVLTGTGPIADAISTVGGIDLNEITEHFELKKIPKHFAIGEMLDYDAPTGGYLLQSCFSMAKYLADHLNGKLIVKNS